MLKINAAALRAVIDARGMTARAVAQLSHVSPRQVQRLANQGGGTTEQTARALAAVLDVDVDVLLDRDVVLPARLRAVPTQRAAS